VSITAIQEEVEAAPAEGAAAAVNPKAAAGKAAAAAKDAAKPAAKPPAKKK
jgi:hypothetical protein